MHQSSARPGVCFWSLCPLPHFTCERHSESVCIPSTSQAAVDPRSRTSQQGRGGPQLLPSASSPLPSRGLVPVGWYQRTPPSGKFCWRICTSWSSGSLQVAHSDAETRNHRPRESPTLGFPDLGKAPGRWGSALPWDPLRTERVSKARPGLALLACAYCHQPRALHSPSVQGDRPVFIPGWLCVWAGSGPPGTGCAENSHRPVASPQSR